MSSATCILALVLALEATGGPAPADLQPVPASAMGSRPLAIGDAVAVSGKYKELVGTDVRLYDCELPFRIEHGELTRKLRELQAQRDNVVIRGTVIAARPSQAPQGTSSSAGEDISGPARAELAVRVESLDRSASDVEVFELLLDRRSPQRLAVPELEDLLRRITISHRRFPDVALIPHFRSAFLEYVERAQPRGGAAQTTALALLRDMHSTFGQKELTLELARRLMQDAAEPPQLAQLLSNIGCRKYKGQWLTYEDFKRQEGFVEHEGAWVQPREKHLAELLRRLDEARQPLFIIRKRTDREYLLLAQKGSLEEGMKLEEVSLAIGFPERVERRMFEQKELTQWSYGTNFCYFYDGLLLKLPDKP